MFARYLPSLCLTACIVFFCHASVSAQESADVETTKQADLKRMVGKWKVTKATMRGRDAPAAILKMVFTIKAEKTIAMRGGPKDVDFKFELEPGKKHHKIKMEATSGEHAGKPAASFYKFDEKQLHLFMPNSPSDQPLEEPDDSLAHFVLEKKLAEK